VVLTIRAAADRRHELEQLPEIEVVERYQLGGARDEALLVADLQDAWAVVAGSERYSAAVLRAVPGLRAIVRWGTGSDAVDLGAATDAGVAVVTTPGANAEAVADMALALMLACLRQLPGLDSAVRNGSWKPAQPSRDLAGATVGIVGLGAVGRAVARRLRGFGCRLLAVEPQADPEFCASAEIELVTLREMLPRLDVLTLHAPLSPATRHLIGASELALLPSHSVLVNASRGQLVDQAALVDALRTGGIAMAGLDVFEREPLGLDEPIAKLPNVVLTGHVAAFTRLALERTGIAVVSHVQELLAGHLPAACLNPEAWRPLSGNARGTDTHTARLGTP
jgi:phosphoglycerate dehydrogenase-like enzyme